MFFKIPNRNDSAWPTRLAAMVLGLAFLSAAGAQTTATESHQGVAANEVVAVKLEQFKVTKNPSGQDALVDAKTVKPGDVVEYRATYTNRDNRPVKGLQATLPIPVGMHYLPKTARPDVGRVQAATQGGSYASEPLMHEVRVNGKLQSEPVPYSQYRSLRWDLGVLPAGGEAVVSVRTQVDGVAEAVTVGAAAKPVTK